MKTILVFLLSLTIGLVLPNPTWPTEEAEAAPAGVEATAGVAAIFIFLLLVIYSANGDVLFRDEGQGPRVYFRI